MGDGRVEQMRLFEYAEPGNGNRGQVGIGANAVGMKGVEAIDAPEI
jgi:hypothetical protein